MIRMVFKSIRDTRVKELMTHGVVTIGENARIIDVVRLLVVENIHGVIVVSDDRKAVGVISEIDIVKSFDEDFNEMKAGDIMSKNLRTIGDEERIEDAARIMKKYGIHRLLILDKDNKPAGILSVADIMKAINEVAEER